MSTRLVFNEDRSGLVRSFSSDKVERVNPIEYHKSYEIEKRATVFKDLLYTKSPVLTSFLDDYFFEKKAIESLDGFFEEFENTEVPENFLKLLETSRKKDQVKLLKGQSLNPEQLMSLIFKSYSDFGYLYSKYSFENLLGSKEGKTLPKFFHLEEDGSIEKFGETDLTDGELKNVITQRKVVVSHFFENEENWHCIFNTYNSLAGRENWKNGQAHFHYISSAFGITKEDFVESMRTGKYRSTPVHIDLLDYGYQEGDAEQK